MRLSLPLLLLLLVLCSCAGGNTAFQKRKMRPGYYVNLRGIENRVRKIEHREPKIDNRKEEGGRSISPFNASIQAVEAEPDSETEQRVTLIASTRDDIAIPNPSIEQPLASAVAQSEFDHPKSETLNLESEPKQIRAFWPGLIALLLAVFAMMGVMFIPFFGVLFCILPIVFAIKALTIDDITSRTLGLVALVLAGGALLFALFFTMIVASGLMLV